MVERSTSEVEQAIAAIYDHRDRDRMQPTIDAFVALLREHPNDPVVLEEVGGAYDTAGDEATAIRYYERAIAAGLTGERLRRCLLQYGSSLRLLGRAEESVAVLTGALDRFPDSPSLLVFLALAQQSAGAADEAVAGLLELIVQHVDAEDVQRYRVAILGNATELRRPEPGAGPC